MKTTINKKQGLYVFNHGKHITTLGFEVVKKRATALSAEMSEPITLHTIGSHKMLSEYNRMVKLAQQRYQSNGWRSKSQLIPEFIDKEGQRVEVIDKYEEKRRFYIGKSTGFIPCHLEIKQKNSSGGEAVTGYPFKSLTFI